jgi:hypothetical protein
MPKIDIRDLERHLIERKRALGIVGNDFLPRNDGSRRTESKRRLLAAIADHAELWATGKQPTAPEPTDEGDAQK